MEETLYYNIEILVVHPSGVNICIGEWEVVCWGGDGEYLLRWLYNFFKYRTYLILELYNCLVGHNVIHYGLVGSCLPSLSSHSLCRSLYIPHFLFLSLIL